MRGQTSVATLAIVVALLVRPAAAQTPAPFTEEALLRGLDYTMQGWPQALGNYGNGAGFVDLDADGDPDVVVMCRADGRIGIFENIGGGYFVDRTMTSAIPVLTQPEGFAAADYDSDGFPDLYVTQFQATNYLLRNLGNFTFSNVTVASNVGAGAQAHTGPSWGDYNNDGRPDIYVSNYAAPNILYKNNLPTVAFSTATSAAGVSGGNGLTFMSVWTDYDRDGDQDLYLSNDRSPQGMPNNKLFKNNMTGTPQFTEQTSSGAQVSIYSMGIGTGDFDGNGYTDFYLTNINSWDTDGSGVGYDGINPLLLNQGNGSFVESAEAWDVDNRTTSWGAIFFDWDNDGRMDLYVNNQFDPNSLFHCTAPATCTEKAAELAVESAKDPTYELPEDPPHIQSYSSAVADVDGDGDLDLLVNNLGHRAELFINQEGQDHNWARLDVVGLAPNTLALGAGVETNVGGAIRFHEHYAGGNGYFGQNERILHVGLGEAEKIDSLTCRWPSGGPTRTLTNLPAGEVWKIYPPQRLCDFDGDGIDHADFEDFADCFHSGFVPGCEIADENGDSSIWVDDLDECYVSAPQDCNGNGTEDLAEIMLDLSLDVDDDKIIDCCEAGPATEPAPIGDTLLGQRNGLGQAEFSWTAPPEDGNHGAAASYDVFRSTSTADAPYALADNVVVTSFTDTDTAPAIAFYLVSARNGCGSSGEEPF